MESVDCAVIGAGPAGLTAALFMYRFRGRCVVFDAGASRTSLIPRGQNHSAFPDDIRSPDLPVRMRVHLAGFGWAVLPVADGAIRPEAKDYRIEATGFQTEMWQRRGRHWSCGVQGRCRASLRPDWMS
jgi:thioredoxin reductase (NADPH)